MTRKAKPASRTTATPGTSDEDAPSIPTREFAERRRRAITLAQERGLDALLVWGRGGTPETFSDVHYFTNQFSPGAWVTPLPGLISGCEHSGVIITADSRATLLVNAFVAENACVDQIRRSWDLTNELVAAISESGLAESRIGIIGHEVLPHSFAAALTATYPRLTLEPADDIAAQLRLRLSPTEIIMMRHAGATGRRIYNAFLAAVKPGTSEGQAVGAALAEAAMIPGCTHWNFLAASGPHAHQLVRTSLPSWNPTQIYQPGDIVHADCYGHVFGYSYDLARTIVVGNKPTAEQSRVISGVENAIAAMSRALKSNVTPRQLFETGLQALNERQLTPLAPAFGHGIGAGFMRPYLFSAGADVAGHDADRPLEPPLGIAFEIIAADDKGNTAYHEDNYVLLENDDVIALTA